MIGVQEYRFNSYECEDIEINVWKKEPCESGEDFEISIENNDSMDNFRFESIETLDMAIEALQKAREYVVSQGKQVAVEGKDNVVVQ